MGKAAMYGINRTYIPNTQADRASRHWASNQAKNKNKGDLFRQVLQKKMEAKNG